MSATKKDLPLLSNDDLLALIAPDQHGQPNYGALLRYFRQQKHWKVEELARYYSLALRAGGWDQEESESVSEQRIYAMENQNKVPKDQKRRWILATLLDIPPFLFGLEALPVPPPLFCWKSVDVAEYRAKLEQYCRLFHHGTVQQAVPHIQRRINHLNHAFRLASSPREKDELLKLLCEYYTLAGDIAHSQLYPDEAIALLSSAVTIAREQHFYDLWAYALRQRGCGYLDRGEITAMREGFAAAQPDFDAAKRDLDEARSLEPYLSPQWYSAILLLAGKVNGQFARNGQELKQGLKLVDRASKQIGKPLDGTPIVLDEERYHMDRARACIMSPVRAARWPETARQALEDAEKAARFISKRRQANRATFWAKTYFVEEFYPIAATLAEDALSMAQEIDSPINVARVQALYRGLRASRYGKGPEVAELGIKLLRVQQPELFT
jgi:transcriptional regulator with XRE-family HTH domain